eukprot:SM000014S00259  [mRNA]  locus=s14:359676:361345:+ [translate_table: standard]
MALRRRRPALPALLLVLAVAAASVAASEDAGPAADVDYSKLRVKELKKLLDERGVECLGCVVRNISPTVHSMGKNVSKRSLVMHDQEKEHLVAKVKESVDLPVLSEEELKARQPPSAADIQRKKDEEIEIQQILEQLKKDGYMKKGAGQKGFDDMPDFSSFVNIKGGPGKDKPRDGKAGGESGAPEELQEEL